MRTGRPPKPTALKILQGNPGKRQLPKNEPIPPAGEVVRPRMGKRAAGVWDRYAPMVEEMGLLTPVDVPAFAMLCALIAEAEFKPRDMPANRIARMEALFGQFGMTPSSRARLGGSGKQKPANPFGALKQAGA
jgi:phage terminase small subunit